MLCWCTQVPRGKEIGQLPALLSSQKGNFHMEILPVPLRWFQWREKEQAVADDSVRDDPGTHYL